MAAPADGLPLSRVFRRVQRAASMVRHPSLLQHGRCPICGHATIFVLTDPQNPRESLVCAHCRSVARNRLVALEILDRTGGRSLRAIAKNGLPLSVYVAAMYGPLLAGLAVGTPGLTTSDLVPRVALGERLDDGSSTCQDLEQLAYSDASFDIVVTEDVLEHVRDPIRAFHEIHRVLRPGGVHIFTVPMWLDAPGLVRVDTSGPEDILLMEPEWHGDAVRGRILSYRVFGHDLFGQLDELGVATRVRLPRYLDRHRGVFDAFALVSRKPS